jgi:hypothetical protein
MSVNIKMFLFKFIEWGNKSKIFVFRVAKRSEHYHFL